MHTKFDIKIEQDIVFRSDESILTISSTRERERKRYREKKGEAGEKEQ